MTLLSFFFKSVSFWVMGSLKNPNLLIKRGEGSSRTWPVSLKVSTELSLKAYPWISVPFYVYDVNHCNTCLASWAVLPLQCPVKMPRAGSASEPVRVISKWNNKRKCLRESLREKEKTNVGMLILSNPSSLSCGSRTLLLMGTPEFLKFKKKKDEAFT